MRLTILALYLGLINTVDLLFNIVAINLFKFNYVDLGLFNALWTIVYIFSARFVNTYVDKGYFRKTIVFSIFSNIIMSTMLVKSIALRNATLLYLSYCMYAVVVSKTRLAIYTSILEYYDSNMWNSVNKILVVKIIVFEGILLITYSKIGFQTIIDNISILLTTVISLNIILVFAVPQPVFLIERVIYRILKSINKMLDPARSSLTISFQPIHIPDRLTIYSNVLTRSFIDRKTILTLLFSLKLSNELLFTPLPLILFKKMNLTTESILQIYGLAKLFAFTLLLFIKLKPLNPGSLIIAIFTRIFSTIFLFTEITSNATAPLLVSLIFYANAILDTSLYNLFLETSSGYRTSDYSIVSEIACFTGSLTSGYLISQIGSIPIVASIFLSTILFTNLLKKI